MTRFGAWARRLMETGWPSTEAGTPEFSLVDLNTASARGDSPRMKVLLVVAHPDDESECAAFLYRMTHELGGVVDQVVVTNGEAGTQYAAPAQAYYGLPLTEREGRKHVPRIRRREVLRAGRILGVRHNYFLGQKDTGFTFDLSAGYEAWEIRRVRQELRALLEREEYDLVVTLLPAPDTHGHHQAAALLTLEAAAELPPDKRPGLLGVRTARERVGSPEFTGLPGYPLTRTTTARPIWSFDRTEPLGGHPALNYSIVVNWIIAEHKSQGMFQMEYGRRTLEDFWLFAVSGASGAARWRKFPTQTFQIQTNREINQCVNY